MAFYLGVGGEVSIGFNLIDFFDEIIDIYNTKYEGVY